MSLRRFTGFAMLVALAAAAPPAGEEKADAQTRAAWALEQIGVKLTRDEKAPGKPVAEARVYTSGVGHNRIVDGELKPLARLPRLHVLDLSYTRIGHAGLKKGSNRGV